MGSPRTSMANLLHRTAFSGLRASRNAAGSLARREMSTAIGKEEELAMQKLYPMYRSSWFGEPGGKGTWSDTKKTWFIVEAYPLFAAIGMGLGVCTLHCARHMFFSPDVFITKSNRSNAMIENYKEGEKWKGSPLRRLGSGKNEEVPSARFSATHCKSSKRVIEFAVFPICSVSEFAVFPNLQLFKSVV